MKIFYVYHSCFIVEDDTHILIFDFFKIPWQKNKSFDIADVLDKNKKILVFVSHSHSDHYSPAIFDWDNGKRDIAYILSDDITIRSPKKNCYIVHEGVAIDIADIQIKVFGSSDQGVSFLVKIGNSCLFHAGDLNWWHWPDDTPEEEKYAADTFKGIIADIRSSITKDHQHIDIAFVPVDPRLEQYTYLGGEYYIKELSPDFLIPMHFWGDFKVTKEFAFVAEKEHVKSAVLTHTLQEIVF